LREEILMNEDELFNLVEGLCLAFTEYICTQFSFSHPYVDGRCIKESSVPNKEKKKATSQYQKIFL
jgi:hypothetical protein